MNEFDQKILKKMIKRASVQLKGDWVFLGGALIPLISRVIRRTSDIDLVGFGSNEQLQTLALVELAMEFGYSPETINQAASIYLKKIPDWKDNLIPIIKDSSANIYRPNLTLYLLLKLGRLSEGDLQDCLEYLRFAKENGESCDHQRVLKSLASKKKDASDAVLNHILELEHAIKRFAS